MIITDKDGKRYIGNKKSNVIFSLEKECAVINEKELEVSSSPNSTMRFESFLDMFGRLTRVLEIMNKAEKNIPLLFGRVYTNKKDEIQLIKKEFIIYNMDLLEKVIGKLYGEILIEFVVINTEKVDLQELINFCKFNKCKYFIHHFGEIEDNEQLLNDKCIRKLYIPNFIKTDVIGLDKSNSKQE